MEDRQKYMEGLFQRMISRNHWERLVTNEILTTPQANILYTSISKCACTQVKFILADLIRYPKNMDRALTPHNLSNSGLIAVASLENRNESYRLFFEDHVFRFAFVRNPLERLISAFVNKLQLNFYTSWENNKREILEDHYSKQIIKIKSDVAGITGQTLDINKDPLTFKEFVHFLSSQDPFDMDRHWYMQTRAMFHDIINYDFLGKVENFTSDIQHVLKSINAPIDLYALDEKQNASGKIFNLEDFYDAGLESLVVKKYEEDFDVLKYPKYQVRGFHSTYTGKEQEEARIYSEIIDSLKDPNPIDPVGVIVVADTIDARLEERLSVIRGFVPTGINIRIIADGKPLSAIQEFESRHDVKVFSRNPSNHIALLNDLIKQTHEPYLLFFLNGSVPAGEFDLQTALRIFWLNDQIKIVTGQPAQNDPSVSLNPYPFPPGIILYDQTLKQLIILTTSLFNNRRYIAGDTDYGFCEVPGDVFLVDKQIFTDRNIWFDRALSHFQHVLIDFSLQVHQQNNIQMAESSCLAFNSNFKGMKRTDSLVTVDTAFFKKWDIIRLILSEKTFQEYHRENDLAYEYPFMLLDCLGNIKEDDRKILEYREKIVFAENELKRLQTELQNLKDSLSWKLTKPFRQSWKTLRSGK